MLKLFVLIGSINMLLAVGLGAFGAHGLPGKLSERMIEIYQTGVQYHMIHAIGILIIAIVADRLGSPAMLLWAGWAMFIGIVFFSGSLYILSISGVKILGAITPIGGLFFMAGWLLLALGVLRNL